MPAAKKKRKKEEKKKKKVKKEACGKIIKKDKSTQMRELNEKSGKQTIETK